MTETLASLSLSDLVSQLQLEALELNLFRGITTNMGTPAVFGGQVLGQSLMAACRTIEGMRAHSMHAYFLRAGDNALPILYDVERTRDGGSFATRRVVAIQRGRPIFTMTASFHKDEAGVQHQRTMPAVLPPEQGKPRSAMLARVKVPFDVRRAAWPEGREAPPFLDPAAGGVREGTGHSWFKTNAPLPDDPALHQALLAYMSDFDFLGTAMRAQGMAHGRVSKMHIASLDHAMWFHRDFRFDDWLLYDSDTPIAHGARGLCRGGFFTADGQLVCSTAQEGLLRAPIDEQGRVIQDLAPPEAG